MASTYYIIATSAKMPGIAGAPRILDLPRAKYIPVTC